MNIRTTVFFLLMLSCLTAMAARLDALVVKVAKGKTSIICTLAGPFTQTVFPLVNPDRVVVDFNQTTAALDVTKVRLGNGVIVKMRSGHPSPHQWRLVLDVKKGVTIKTSLWQTPKAKGLRIDLLEKGAYSQPTHNHQGTMAKTIALASAKERLSVKKPVQVRHSPARTMRDVIVVLDPGHGGKDPGAIGPRRSAEKNVTLAIALKLKQLIDKQPGMRAVLTRNGDYYVGLRRRLDIARRYNGDVFVSIHADAFINHHSNGASVFALSQNGATSEAARWLAEKENYSELGGVNLSDLDDQNGVIRTVLIDLSQTATIGASLQMGTQVLKNLDKMTKLHNEEVEQARFVVLKSPDIPSILIETGFISNHQEEKNLTSSYYQSRLTQAIFAGVKRYFWDHPPQGSRIEAMANVNYHVVQSGNTPQYRNVALTTAKPTRRFRAPWA